MPLATKSCREPKMLSNFIQPRAGFLTIAIALFALLSPVPSLSQVGKSGLTGTVTDATGAVAPNVKITAQNGATNLTWSAMTSASGAYSIPDLPPGYYTVSAEATGFQKSVV